jgi:hypothetical protein
VAGCLDVVDRDREMEGRQRWRRHASLSTPHARQVATT